MALTGIEIYKFLPKTNCKKCGFPTCLAFAMKVSQKGVDITACPDLSPEAKEALEAAGRPPIRLVTIGSDGKKIEVGNEVVMFRHEKTFYHKPGLFIRVRDDEAADGIKAKVAETDAYKVDYVGLELTLAFLQAPELGGHRGQERPDLTLIEPASGCGEAGLCH